MNGRHSLLVRAMSAAIKVSRSFNAMTYNSAAAMLAFRRERMNSAFEAIEIMGDAVNHDFQRLVVLIAAYFALSHRLPL